MENIFLFILFCFGNVIFYHFHTFQFPFILFHYFNLCCGLILCNCVNYFHDFSFLLIIGCNFWNHRNLSHCPTFRSTVFLFLGNEEFAQKLFSVIVMLTIPKLRICVFLLLSLIHFVFGSKNLNDSYFFGVEFFVKSCNLSMFIFLCRLFRP